MEDKIFRIAIIASLALHLVFLIRFYVSKEESKLFKEAPQMSYKIETSLDKPTKSEVLVEKTQPPKMQEVLEVPSSGQMFVEKDIVKASRDIGDHFKIFDRKPEKIKGAKVSKEVTIPVMRSEKINTPSYTTYYQVVRERIRDRAYSNYTRLSSGEVYLTFIIRQDGSLVELQILSDKTTANDFLKQVGVRSVREASPFPPFPQDLNYPELTFNVSISFQYKE